MALSLDPLVPCSLYGACPPGEDKPAIQGTKASPLNPHFATPAIEPSDQTVWPGVLQRTFCPGNGNGGYGLQNSRSPTTAPLKPSTRFHHIWGNVGVKTGEVALSDDEAGSMNVSSSRVSRSFRIGVPLVGLCEQEVQKVILRDDLDPRPGFPQTERLLKLACSPTICELNEVTVANH